MKTNRKAKQVCNQCGKEFYVVYHPNGYYDYCDDVCDCDSDFRPANGEPSITEYLKMRKDVEEVEWLDENVPCGIIVDSDTILADFMHDCDFEVSGLSQDIMRIWKDSEDKKSIEDLFEVLVGTSFRNYLDCCLADITKSA